MRRLENRLLGVDQGQVALFSDFENDGPMWSGHGPRAVRIDVAFSQAFKSIPIVQVALSMWDMDQTTNARADLTTEAVTKEGFTLVFKTWGDSKIARARASWLALGEATHEDDWDIG